MVQTLSERAQRFVQTWERRPHVEDLGLVRAAIEEVGLPVTEPVLDFHRTFAGYMTEVWGEWGPLGIIHREATGASWSWFKPMKVGCYIGVDGKAGAPLLACADVHVSHEMMISLDGAFQSNGPEASSYFLWTEQSAFMWDFSMTRPWRHLLLADDPQVLAPILRARLAGCRIDALSDDLGQVYGTERFAVSIVHQGGRCDVLVSDGELPREFADLKVLPPPGGKSGRTKRNT